ncbi:myb [Dorcoceras hygrometricum]|uniref:Myb n=1 Tax=Dorcoceras hygrometricum TaxID=472368 RepID=A0A2Z6ZX27_9LAMI|nr:myb [Dorcoceras hygrometricum]
MTEQLRAEERRTKQMRARKYQIRSAQRSDHLRAYKSSAVLRTYQIGRLAQISNSNKISLEEEQGSTNRISRDSNILEKERSRTYQMRRDQLRTAQKESGSDNQEQYSFVSYQIRALQQISSHKKRRA